MDVDEPNQRWSLDFLSDTFGACGKFRILAVHDDCCRENIGLIADTRISGARVAQELDALIRVYGKPACIVSDNGTEVTSIAILKWTNDNKVEWQYIDPGKRNRMATSNPSRAACATNASTRKSSTPWLTPAARSPFGATITIPSGRIHRWATNTRRSAPGP